MKIALTDLAIHRLTEGTYWDTHLPSFGIRIGKHRKTYVVMTGRDRRLTSLGHHPEVPLKLARSRARAKMGHSLSPGLIAFPEAVLSFQEAARTRTKSNTLNQYLYYLNSMGFTKPVSEISRADIAEKLKLWDGKPTAQNYAHTTLRVFLNWCLSEELIEKHPLIRSRPPNKLESRDRVLTDDELKAIWNATPDNTYGKLVRCLMLTGQRRMEITNLKPENVNTVLTLTIKGGKTHILPLTPLVKYNLTVPFKFNDWSRSKTRLDKACGVSNWGHHDLRRTLASKLAEMQVPIVTIERILGHSLGKIAAIYNRYSYLKEMEEALLTYEAFIRKLVAPRA